MTDWLNTLQKERDEIRAIAYTLYAMSYNQGQVGNSYLMERLASLAERLERCELNINSAENGVINELVQNAEHSSQNMVNAMLTGIRMKNDE